MKGKIQTIVSTSAMLCPFHFFLRLVFSVQSSSFFLETPAATCSIRGSMLVSRNRWVAFPEPPCLQGYTGLQCLKLCSHTLSISVSIFAPRSWKIMCISGSSLENVRSKSELGVLFRLWVIPGCVWSTWFQKSSGPVLHASIALLNSGKIEHSLAINTFNNFFQNGFPGNLAGSISNEISWKYQNSVYEIII